MSQRTPARQPFDLKPGEEGLPPDSTKPPSMLAWLRIWFAALTRPTEAGYSALFSDLPVSRATALAWLVTAGIAAAIISMVTYAAPIEVVALATACALPIFAIIYVALTVITTRSALWMSAQMGGGGGEAAGGGETAGGSLDRLLVALAAINAPMAILSAVSYLLPFGAWIAYALALYWIYLTVLAIKVLCELKWGQAVLASGVFILLSALVVLMNVGFSFIPTPAG